MMWHGKEKLFPKDKKLLEIRVTKSVLFLTERELMTSLPKVLLELAIQRGKAIQRGRKMRRYRKLIEEQSKREQPRFGCGPF